jgi:L,D-peptidoglycan transpeptidase YkuD (ErfK/YbiS/YcfS/YnhG family)
MDGTTQLIVVLARGWTARSAVLQAFERESASAPWHPATSAVTAGIGRNGLAWGDGFHNRVLEPSLSPVKVEGDGRSPAGIFEIPHALGFDAAAAGWKMPYVRLGPTVECIDFADSAYYNQVIDWSGIPDLESRLDPNRPRPVELFRVGFFVGHNYAPGTPGRGSCIYLHLRTRPDAVTAGCTAVDDAVARQLLAWLDPSRKPLFVALPQTEYDRYRESWDLP